MNLHHLAVFHAVATTGSISRGAERLMVSQPAVSRQIKELESSLRAKLFDRHAKGVMVTATGRILEECAARVFALVDEAERALDDLSSLRRGRLSVGAGPTAGVYLLPWVMVQFRQRFPNIQLRLETEGPDVLRHRLLDGVVDFALTEAIITAAGLESLPFSYDVLVPIAAAGNPIARQRSVSAEEFCRQPFISRQVESGGKSFVERTLTARGMDPQPILTVASTEAIKQAVIAGLGVAMVSRLAIGMEVAAGQLVELPVKRVSIRYPIFYVRRQNRTEGAAVKAFLSIVGELMGKMRG